MADWLRDLRAHYREEAGTSDTITQLLPTEQLERLAWGVRRGRRQAKVPAEARRETAAEPRRWGYALERLLTEACNPPRRPHADRSPAYAD
jgi:hypothetical protein